MAGGGVIIRMDTDDLEQHRGQLEELARAGGDLRDPMNECGLWMQKSIAETFKAEGRPKWQALSAVTRRIRARLGKPGRILDVDSFLRASFIPGRSDAFYAVDRSGMILGSRLPYSIFHQTGIPAGRFKVFGRIAGRLPKRVMAWFHRKDIDEFASIFAHWIREAWRESKRKKGLK